MSRGVVTDKVNKFDKVQLIQGGTAGERSILYDADGAIDPNCPLVRFKNPTGGDASLAMTLADARHPGFTMTLIAEDAAVGEDIVLTPANFLGFTTITFDGDGQSAILKFVNGNWVALGAVGATIA